MGNSVGCCKKTSSSIIQSVDKDLSNLPNIVNKLNENHKIIPEIESKTNTATVTNVISNNKNISNIIPYMHKRSESEKNSHIDNNNKNHNIKSMFKMSLPDGDQYEL